MERTGFSEHTGLESIQLNGVIRLAKELPWILNGFRDGSTLKRFNKKDILAIVNLLSKLDKHSWPNYFNGKSCFCIDKDGKPCLRTADEYKARIISNEYFEGTANGGTNNE